ncbi:hypothetical protein ACJRO7_009975 [Eucalyptus globulus]|uniref:non-specific serine/threonine protein kinase n=1 Tax=Eucalyptus globulus TaxID=34317 RepID=A0ABD3LG12_EUCGL
MPSHHLLCILSPSLSLLLFFFFNGNFHGVHSTFSTICDPVSSSFPCGSVFIRYPFWNESDAPVHCGYPGLGLICPYDSPHPILHLGDEDFFVTDINYDDRTLTLVDIHVAGQECPRARHNLTIGSLPLDYNSADVNLTFLFNCSAPPPESSHFVAIDCLQFRRKRSYVSVNVSWEEEEAADCEDTVVAPVKGTEVTATNVVKEFAGAMSPGFVLDWEAARECGACEYSGGRCASNQTEQLLCFCKDGSNHTDGSVCKGRIEVCVRFLSFFSNGFASMFANRHDCFFQRLLLLSCV